MLQPLHRILVYRTWVWHFQISPITTLYFLAHLNTTCSRGAFRITWCPSFVRRASTVVCRASSARSSCTIRTWNNSLKNLLLRNRWSDFEIISQDCSLGDPFQKSFAKFWSVNKHDSDEWGLFSIYGHEEILKKSSSPKQLFKFWNIFTEIFLLWLFSEIVRGILIRH